jgi:hypothetical protein
MQAERAAYSLYEDLTVSPDRRPIQRGYRGYYV